jgi:hypothetical protein
MSLKVNSQISRVGRIGFVGAFFLFALACEKKEGPNQAIPVPTAFVGVDSSILIHRAKGESVYVPVYAHIPISEKRIMSLRTILSIRNTSRKESLIISEIDYFDTNGKLLKQFRACPSIS